MSGLRIQTTGYDAWIRPRRPVTDAERRAWHGKVKPMEHPSFLERWFG